MKRTRQQKNANGGEANQCVIPHWLCLNIYALWSQFSNMSLPSSFSSRRTRRNVRYISFKLILAIWFVLPLALENWKSAIVFAQSAPPECPHDTKSQYEWESMDFYELLGLKVSSDKNKRRRKTAVVDTSKIDAKDIRKAYRKQAQLWHPDKTAKNQNDNDTSIAITVEESNARFSRIAQAYEILKDAEKRQDYDSFLEYCKRDNSGDTIADQSSHLQKKFSKVWENIRDPFRVFEDFFSGVEDNEGDSFKEEAFDPDDPFSFIRYHQQQQQDRRHRRSNQQHAPPTQDRPARIFQGKENLYDPTTGEAVLRVTQTEEFQPQDSYTGRFYYRIIAQDFKQRYDPYSAGLAYVPITDPYLQEDGYRYQSSGKGAATSSASADVLDSLLHSWEVLTPDSKLLVSPNHRFVAGLSPDDCELLIMVDSPMEEHGSAHYQGQMFGDDDVYWTSNRETPPNPFGKSYNANDGSGSCFAVLKGPHLIVARGDPKGFGNRILWYSKSGLEDEEADTKASNRHSYYEHEDEWGFWHRRPRSYLAQLDDDGSLAVYSVWSVPVDPDQGVFSRFFMAVKDLYHGRVPAQTQYGHLYYHSSSRSESSSSSSQIVYKRCIYSTSPVGCFRLGRRLAQLSLEVYFRIKNVISKMNHVADTWLDLIYEEDDIFYSLKESLWKNSHAFGSKMASSSARFVRKVMEYFIQEERKSGW